MFKKIIALTLCLLMFTISAVASPSSWAVSEINSAKSKNLVPESLLSDYQNFITREEFSSLAVLLYEALSGNKAPVSESIFADTKNSDVAAAYSLGIVKGVSDTEFAPQNNITRQEIATMFLRCAQAALPTISAEQTYVNTFPDEWNISDWAKSAVQFANMCEVMLGDENKYVNPKNNTTREQAMAMVLRIYNALKPRDNTIMSSYGFLSSGNTSSNMTNGAFAVTALDGKLYISDNSGIYSHSNKAYITTKKAKAIFADTSVLYYIGEDNAIYSIGYNGSDEKKLFDSAVSFSVSGEYIYINDGSQLISFRPDDNTHKFLSEHVTSVPIAKVNNVIFAIDKGIYSINTTSKEITEIYSGKAVNLVADSNDLYFLNEEGYVCYIKNNGEDFKVISDKKANSICAYQGGVSYTGEDGIYKCTKDKKFNIKVTNDTNCLVNSYEKTLYIKTNDGKIRSVNPITAESSAIN